MSDFDDKLKRALENGKPIEFEREETLRQMIAQTFRSRLRWMVVFLWVEAVAVCVVAVWAGMRLYHAQELKPLIVYATVLIISAIFFVLVKVVGWQWAIKYSILREIKRLELQVAGLKERE
jgi:ABC-type sugar transport system permease subunit